MTQDFYLKSQVLHEEFQKRELQYLNIERKLNSSMVWKKDYNLPLQEYLQKIDQREKETEKIYKNILKQMDDLDQHSDVLSMKLEKLGVLRTSITTPSIPNWTSRLDSNIGSNIEHSYQTGAHSLHIATDVLPPSFKSVSVQTEGIMYCEKCNSLKKMNNQPDNLLGGSLLLNSNAEINDQIKTVHSLNPMHDFNNLCNETIAISQPAEASSKDLLRSENQENVLTKSEIEKINEEPSEHKLSMSSKLDIRKTIENQFEQSAQSVEEDALVQVPKKEEKLIVSQSFESKKSEGIKTVHVELRRDTAVSKSEVESINNEFDFLESDDITVQSKKERKESSRSFKSPTDLTIRSPEKGPSSEKHSNEQKLNFKSEKQENKALHQIPELNASDDKSETSGSVSGLLSPNTSVISDSDSIDGKGSPLTASAAYQALLGNNIFPRKTPKNVPDSESEDEVENALASAVQRTHKKSKLSAKQKKDEMTFQPVEAKPVDKPTKVSSMNKPQSKLSKNTRKVLGLDTSSGSEVEMAIKPPPGKKVEDDSDEFDFYD